MFTSGGGPSGPSGDAVDRFGGPARAAQTSDLESEKRGVSKHRNLTPGDSVHGLGVAGHGRSQRNHNGDEEPARGPDDERSDPRELFLEGKASASQQPPEVTTQQATTANSKTANSRTNSKTWAQWGLETGIWGLATGLEAGLLPDVLGSDPAKPLRHVQLDRVTWPNTIWRFQELHVSDVWVGRVVVTVMLLRRTATS